MTTENKIDEIMQQVNIYATLRYDSDNSQSATERIGKARIKLQTMLREAIEN